MYSQIVNAIMGFAEAAKHGTIYDYALIAGLALFAFCLLMVLWKMLRHALFCLKRSRQLSEWRKAKPPRQEPSFEEQIVR